MRQVMLLMLSCVVANVTANAKDAPVALPDWMSGHWCSDHADQHADELWLPAAGGMMIGLSRTVAGGRTTEFEFLRIESIDGLPTYLAQPKGVAATAFKRTDGGSNWVRFENPAHDFPTRVEYRRSGATLHAEIAGPGKDGREMKIPFEFKDCGR